MLFFSGEVADKVEIAVGAGSCKLDPGAKYGTITLPKCQMGSKRQLFKLGLCAGFFSTFRGGNLAIASNIYDRL